jgi:hypothetical protein
MIGVLRIYIHKETAKEADNRYETRFTFFRHSRAGGNPEQLESLYPRLPGGQD